MKSKLDENRGTRGLELLRAAGHDVMTARLQGLAGTADDNLFEVCRRESRALITLDHDFGNVLRFAPENGPGVIILEVGPRATLQALLDRLRDMLVVLRSHELVGLLWIIEPGRARIHQGRSDVC